MRLPRARSIRQRLMLISAAIALLTLGLAGTLFVVNDVRMLRGQMVRDLEVLSVVVGENCLSALVFDAPETAEKNLASLRREQQIRWAVLYDREGRPFARYLRDPGQQPPAPVGSGEGVFLDVSPVGLGSVEVVRRLDLEGEPVGRIHIHARTDALAAQLRHSGWWVGLLLVLTLGVALLFASRLQRRVSEPILTLAASARAVSESADYGLRVRPPDSDDEIAALFRGFNAMLEQIERRERELEHIRAHLEQLVEERTRALDGSLREQRLILENLPLGVVRLVGRRIVGVNPRAAELFGAEEDDMLGKSTEHFYPNRAAFEEVGRVAYPTMAAGGVHRGDRLLQRRDGTPFWCRMIGQNVDPDDPAPGSIWILDDIDRDKALEDGLRAARQSAEAASRAKDAFLANMSHELRTPLNSVLGFVQILEQDGRLDEAQRRQVQAIGVGGERLLGLINEVLDLTRIEAGRLELRPVTWDSGELLDELSQMFRVRAERKGIALIVEPAADLPRRLTCDLKCLHQVLVNLLDNAVKFTDRGGVTLGVAVEDGSLLVTVADTGAGIPADRLPSIFEPFQQAGDAGSRAQGLGLGLAISRGLVERMGGSLSVESTAGAGCTFRARVPVQTAAPAGEGAPQAPEAGRIAGYRRTEGSGPFRILVADDQAENREVLRALLAALGFDVAEAATGRECLERAVARPPDLILMDLRMPELDGIEATGRLRKEDRTRHVPIVAVTAAAFAEDREGALVAGCDAHLPKPVHLGALAGVLEALLPLRWDRLPAAPGEGLPPATEVLPAEQAARFARLVETGNLTGVATLAEELARSGRYPVLARRMTVLAEEFDLAALRRLLPAPGGDGGDAAG